MKKFFSGILKGFIFTVIGGFAFLWLFSVVFPRAYNVLEEKILGIEADTVMTVIQNQDTLVDTKPNVEEFKIPKENVRSIQLEHKNGCYIIPTKVNGVPMKMTLDTGASHLTLSIVEYEFLRKQGLMDETAVQEGECTIANGEKVKCYFGKISELTIGDVTLKDVECDIMEQQDAPLLLGMNVLKKLGNFSIDYQRNLLILR